jgi:hypothetical protein
MDAERLHLQPRNENGRGMPPHPSSSRDFTPPFSLVERENRAMKPSSHAAFIRPSLVIASCTFGRAATRAL